MFLKKLIMILCSMSAMTYAADSSPKSPEIVVVGAGLGGLTAAYRLHKKGKNVNVYEARTRIGGRVHTVLIKNQDGGYSYVELGGQNINDAPNPKNILALAKELDVKITEDYVNPSAVFFDGTDLYNPYSLASKQNIALNFQNLENIKLPRDMGTILDLFFGKEPSILKRFIRCRLASFEGSPPEDLAVCEYNEKTFFGMVVSLLDADPENKKLSDSKSSNNNKKIKRLIAKEGNATLPLKLAEKIGTDKIHLGHVLTHVKEVENKKIQLTFSNTQTQTTTITTCDKLILAMPCSVFGSITFDTTVLPKERMDAMKKVSYGQNGKIMVPVKKSQTHAIVTDDMIAFDNADHKVVTLYISGKAASTLNQETKEHFERGLKAIKAGFPLSSVNDSPPVIPAEEQLSSYDGPVVKSWADDIHAKGSYTNYGTEMAEQQEKITPYKNITVRAPFAPQDDRVFFVGEHATTLTALGTMEAAVESGERIASVL